MKKGEKQQQKKSNTFSFLRRGIQKNKVGRKRRRKNEGKMKLIFLACKQEKKNNN